MKVLELGSGTGDVSLVLADLVGPSGRVVGVELKLAAVEQRLDRDSWPPVGGTSNTWRALLSRSNWSKISTQW